MTMNNTQLASVCKAVAPKYRHAVPATVTNINWANEKVHAMSVIGASRGLKDCTAESLERSILQAGSIGLTLNPTVSHCYLIPRRARRRKAGESDVEYSKVPSFAYASPSYRGLMHLAVSSGAVRFLRAEIIYKGDLFRYFGPHKDPMYEADLTKQGQRTEGNATGVFAIAKTKEGDYLCEYIDRDTIQKIRNMSEMKDGAIWNPNKMWTEGWKKAAIRRLYKTLPDSAPLIHEAMAVLNQHEGMATGEQAQDQEREVEAVVLISDEQALKLHACLTENDLEGGDATRWLDRLAKKYGVANHQNIPADKFDDAMATLKDAMKGRAAE